MEFHPYYLQFDNGRYSNGLYFKVILGIHCHTGWILFHWFVDIVINIFVFLNLYFLIVLATNLFYDTGTIEYLLFLALAPKFPKLLQFWADSERKLPFFNDLKGKRRFIFKIRFIGFGFLILALSMNHQKLVNAFNRNKHKNLIDNIPS